MMNALASRIRFFIHKQSFLFFPAIVVCSILVCIFYFSERHVDQSYTLDLGSATDTDARNYFFLDQFTKVQKEQGKKYDYRKILLSNLQTHLTLSHRIHEDQEVTIRARVQTDASVYYNMYCVRCVISDKKSTQRMTGALYDNRLNGYTFVQSFSEGSVYVRREAYAKTMSTRASSLLDWVKATQTAIPQITIDDVDSRLNRSDFVNTTLIANTTQQSIPLRIRGAAQFVVYLDGSLEATVTKRDLNWYAGADSARISLASLSEPDLSLGSVILADDSDSEALKNIKPDVLGTLHIDHLPAGAYILSITEEDVNQYSDFQLVNLSINTNKVMIKGSSITMMGPVRVYTNSTRASVLSVFAWTGKQVQTISVDDSPATTIGLTDINTWKEIEAPAGAHSFSTQSALRINTGDEYIAFTTDGLFDPYVIRISSVHPDVILTATTVHNEKNGWVSIEKRIPVSVLMQAWGVQEKDARSVHTLDIVLYTQESVDFSARTKQFTKKDSHYRSVYVGEHAVLFARLGVSSAEDLRTYVSAKEWLELHAPVRSAVGFMGKTSSLAPFVSPQYPVKTGQTSIDAGIHGSAQMMTIFGDTLGLTGRLGTDTTAAAEIHIIEIESGDVVSTISVDASASRTVSFALSKEGIRPGSYRIDFECLVGDCVFGRLRLNSPYSVFTESVGFVNPSSWYTALYRDDIRFEFGDESTSTVTINAQQYPLADRYRNISNQVSLKPGEYAITTDGAAQFSTAYISPTQSSFFLPYVYDFEPIADQDYILMHHSVPGVAIDTLGIDIHSPR